VKNRLLILLLGILLSAAAKAQSPVGIDDPALKYVNAYPNPATSILNIKIQKGNSRSYTFQIINSIGKQIYRAASLPPFFSINVRGDGFYRGIYVYQLLDRNGSVVESGKIMVVN
jgi:hypothetical protein